MSSLLQKKCIDYPRGAPSLKGDQQADLAKETPDWTLVNGERIRREFAFRKYLDGISWIAAVGAIAEQENHHPEITILYRKVIVEVWTHTVKGLSENDFILAAKLDASYRELMASKP